MEISVTIDASGRWWVGSEASDVEDYLRAYKAEGYEIDETRMCRCQCGSMVFQLEADRDEGCALRTCEACHTKHFICDSAEYWGEAEPESWECSECGCKTCNLGVGFSLYEPGAAEPRDVRWVSIGNRCTNCGILGSFLDWKVGYGPSYQLLEQA
jgi:hypothetical protein